MSMLQLVRLALLVVPRTSAFDCVHRQSKYSLSWKSGQPRQHSLNSRHLWISNHVPASNLQYSSFQHMHMFHKLSLPQWHLPIGPHTLSSLAEHSNTVDSDSPTATTITNVTTIPTSQPMVETKQLENNCKTIVQRVQQLEIPLDRHNATNITELQRYNNRVILLENILDKKVQELQIMTNRVTLLELVWNRHIQNHPPNEKDAADNSMSVLREEKERAEQQLLAFTRNQSECEKQYHSTISELMDKIALLENEQSLQKTTNSDLQEKSRNLQQLQRQQQNEIAKQRQVNVELQSKLSNLLEAYEELDQLQNHTEVTLRNYQLQLKNLRNENDKLVQREQQTTLLHQSSFNESQLLLKDTRRNYQRLLHDSQNTYEKLLAEEKAISQEWKNKWEDVVSQQNHSKWESLSIETRREEEWLQLQNKLEEMTLANATAMEKVQALEMELQCCNESSVEKQMKQQQQQQLQEYLQAQLQEYYETIQDQMAEITKYKQQISDREKQFEDSMLIATNSVESSQRREEGLLAIIKELEYELTQTQNQTDIARKGFYEMSNSLNTTNNYNDLIETNAALLQCNQQLISAIEQLQCKVDQIIETQESTVLEKITIKQGLNNFHPGELNNMNIQKQQKWWKYLLRPWTIFR